MILVKMVSCCTIDIAQKLNIELKPCDRWEVDLKEKKVIIYKVASEVSNCIN